MKIASQETATRIRTQTSQISFVKQSSKHLSELLFNRKDSLQTRRQNLRTLRDLSLSALAYAGVRIGDVRGHTTAKPPQGELGPAISYLHQSEIIADGKWGENEWNYSWAGVKGLRSELLTNHDSDFAYFAIVNKRNLSIRPTLFGSIKLDTLHDAGFNPQKDDYTFSIVWTSDKEYDVKTSQGTGDGWKLIDNHPEFKAASGLTKTPFDEKNELLFYEFAVPKSLIGNSKIMGIQYMSLDSEQIWWPSRDPDKPNTWEDLIYKNEKIPESEIIIPEFPYGKELIAGLSLLLPLMGLEFIRHRRNELATTR